MRRRCVTALPCLCILLVSLGHEAHASNLQDRIIRSIASVVPEEKSQSGLRLSLAESKDMPTPISYRIVPLNVQRVKGSTGIEAGMHELILTAGGRETMRQRFLALPDLDSDLHVDFRKDTGFTLQQSIDLPQLKFAKSRKEISKDSLAILDYLAALMEDEPDIRSLSIRVHTDSGGDENRNRSLTQARAEQVRYQLLLKGIEPERLEALGMGSTEPLVPNTTRENRLQNRRTEYVVHVL